MILFLFIFFCQFKLRDEFPSAAKLRGRLHIARCCRVLWYGPPYRISKRSNSSRFYDAKWSSELGRVSTQWPCTNLADFGSRDSRKPSLVARDRRSQCARFIDISSVRLHFAYAYLEVSDFSQPQQFSSARDQLTIPRISRFIFVYIPNASL